MSDDVHATGPMYRPSREDDSGIGAGTRRILYLTGCGGLALLVAVAIYGFTGHSGGGVVPVVQADQHPLRVKPADPGGMAVTAVEKPADPNDSRLAPGTEEPNRRALLAITGPGAVHPPVIAPQPHPKSVTVQLSAAKSEAQAQVMWDGLARKMPDLFAPRHALFQKANESGPAPWRLRTGGFTDTAQAKAFCDKVKAKGGQCALVDS
jgi:hypothetical protein